MQWAEAAAQVAGEMGLPLVILGGAGDLNGEAAELADALRFAGERFLHADDLACLVRAVYVIAAPSEKYRSYMFCNGSAVIDPHGVVVDQAGVSVFRPKSD